jgi:hypothetical protein
VREGKEKEKMLVYEVADLRERMLAEFDSGQTGALRSVDSTPKLLEDSRGQIRPSQQTPQRIPVCDKRVVSR